MQMHSKSIATLCAFRPGDSSRRLAEDSSTQRAQNTAVERENADHREIFWCFQKKSKFKMS